MGKEKSPRRVADNEALSVGTQIRGSAQKLNLVAGLIRGKRAEDAMNILTFCKKAMAMEARKVLESAIANVHMTCMGRVLRMRTMALPTWPPPNRATFWR